jgi:adenylylsulfate kinase
MNVPKKIKGATAIWFTGLSGSGKTTLACELKRLLKNNGCVTSLFDGDVMRTGLNKDLGFSLEDRFENIRRVAEVNKLFLDTGISTINAFISPTEEIRKMARKIIGTERFFEIYLTTPLQVCIQRDPKGWYKKIANGEIKNFTGVDSVFEPAQFADLLLDTSQKSLPECMEIILNTLEGGKTN